MLKYTNVKTIDLTDWDQLVRETYGKPYSFQQQDGCQSRGSFNISVPSEDSNDKYMNKSIPEVINGVEMGVKFDIWLKRSPDEPLNPTKQELKTCGYYWGKTEEDEMEWKQSESHINLFWERNFYPDIYTLANDLYNKGLIEAGDYVINIDW